MKCRRRRRRGFTREKPAGVTRATLVSAQTSIAEGIMRHTHPPAFVTSAGSNGGDAGHALASNPFVPFP